MIKRFSFIMVCASILLLSWFGWGNGAPGMGSRQHRAVLFFYKTNGDIADTSGGALMKLYSNQYDADTTGHHITADYTESYDGAATWYLDNPTHDMYDCYFDSAGVVSKLADDYLIGGRSAGFSFVNDSTAFATGIVGTIALLDEGVKTADIDSAAIITRHLSQDGADGVAALIEFGDISNVSFGTEATGDVTYYNGTAWVNLASGDENEVLTISSGLPAWEVSPGYNWADTSRTGASKISADAEDLTPGLYWHEYKSGVLVGDAIHFVWAKTPYYGATKGGLAMKAFCDTSGVIDFQIEGRTWGNLLSTFNDGADSTFVYTIVTPGFSFDSAR